MEQGGCRLIAEVAAFQKRSRLAEVAAAIAARGRTRWGIEEESTNGGSGCGCCSRPDVVGNHYRLTARIQLVLGKRL
ncbi:hypothetical protein B296_00038472 [Ensete ventricosum]|uniref:Uncharacterized protein n=1 Tax=Ensete ventricosum TaxID=4639 RepID=A0A426ZDJ2_ENSVE|nr:hypothetical protein B296_00038472 [Ensete ventricosum]